MEQKRCGICTSVIEEYPCPLCGYNGELEQPSPRRSTRLAQEELTLEQPVHTAPKKTKKTTKSTRKKKKKRGSSLVNWLVGILAVLVLGMMAAAFFTVHSWDSATCTAPATCRLCHKTQGEPLPHTWVGTCTEPGVCSVCGALQPQAPGHSWQRTDCLTPGSCSVCGEPEPQAPGHDWQAADCTNPEVCTRCGAKSGSPLGHAWDGVTQPAACSRCGEALTEEQQARSLLDTQSRSVFDRLFAARNWEAVFDAAVNIPARENAAHYAAYMSAYDQQQPELRTLTADGESPSYAVWMGQEQIAEFTLRRKHDGTPGWELDAVQLIIAHPVTVTVVTGDNATVLVNGIPLDEAQIINRTESPAAEFLPEGTLGLEEWTWQVSGLMTEPELTVCGTSGTVLPLSRDEKTGIYRTEAAEGELTDSEKDVVFAALEGYSGFMINAAGARNSVTRYFENGTQTCKDILYMGSELWMNKDRGHQFLNEEILAFRRFSDTLFAVRAQLILRATLVNGSSRDYTVTETMFFAQRNGSWLCYAMTNRDVLAPAGPAPGYDADNWTDHPDGIRIDTYSGPNFNAHIMLVKDPSRVYLGLSSYNGFSMNLAGKRLTEAIVDEQAVAAINAGAFYDDGTSNICVGSTPAGLTIYDGRVVSNVYTGLVPEKGFCGLDADNRLVVADSMTEARAAELNIRYGCEFGPVLIQDSQINQEAYRKEGYNPRTAVGQRADGTLIFVCADGRQAGSLGATYGELIDLLVAYGAVNACNMDGGSSTVMLTRDAENGVQFVNCYSVLQSEPRRMPTYWLVRPE